jgi:hypothetical protein
MEVVTLISKCRIILTGNYGIIIIINTSKLKIIVIQNSGECIYKPYVMVSSECTGNVTETWLIFYESAGNNSSGKQAATSTGATQSYSAANSGSSGKPAFTAVTAKSSSSANFSTAAKTFGGRKYPKVCCDVMAEIKVC